jgi:integrase
MPEATFVLKEPASKEPTLVYLFFYFNGQQLKFSTGQKIRPKFWNSTTQFAKETRFFPEYAEFNELLKNLRSTVSNNYRKLINDKVKPTPELLRGSLNEFLQKASNSPTDFISFIDELINTSAKGATTIKQYKQTLKRLKDFKEFSKKKMEFNSVDLEFYETFVRYLTNEKKYGVNTIGATIKNIKVFMNVALERGLTNNVQFKSKNFKKVHESSESIYLTTTEIERLYKLDTSKNVRLDKVKDLFVIGCYTGLRFSDLTSLKEENFIENKSKVRIKTEKTGELVVIPLHPYVKAVLAKNNGIPPSIISNQKMNDYLKELGELAEINESVLINSTRGGIRHNEVFKKHQLITSHTARRSFATNAYLNNVPTLSIMKITGHRTEKAFMLYIKMSQEDNANKLLNHPFFN